MFPGLIKFWLILLVSFFNKQSFWICLIILKATTALDLLTKQLNDGIPIEENGVRETDEHYRDIIDFTIITLIKKYAHMANEIETIKGTTEERIKQILNVINS